MTPLLAALPAFAQTTVYSNSFSSDASGFSSSLRSTTPGTSSHAADSFLGEFGGTSTQTLTLTGLATHTSTTLAFDFYAIRSLDGNGAFGGGADTFTVTAGQSSGTTTLLSTNFANYPGNTQGFGGSNGVGGYNQTGTYAVQTGAAEVNTLGYTFNGTPMDAVYHLTFTFADASPTLTFNFTSGFSEGLDNESYGLDNVVVTTNATTSAAAPEPATLALALTGVPFVGLALARRRKR